MELRNSLFRFPTSEEAPHQAWVERVSVFIASTGTVVSTSLGWVFELGTHPDMPFHQKKNLALINRASFIGLLLALPGTFLLVVMGFEQPFSLLVGGVVAACLVLALNAVKQARWSEPIFAYAPALLTLGYHLVQLHGGNMHDPLRTILTTQAMCLGLLVPLLIYGYEPRLKVVGVLSSCVLLFLIFNVASLRMGAFQGELLSGANSGVFSMLSAFQYTGLAACVLFVQRYSMKQELQAQSSNEKLYYLATRDGMTGIFNHAFMEQTIQDAINRSRRSGNPLSLLMLDVDYFKQINDNFGHNAGDEVLINLVQVLNYSKRSTDYLGRWGGDELILLLSDTNLAGASNLAEKLRNRVSNTGFPHSRHVTISLGASQYREGDSLMSFIERADAAMYRAKRGGRNRVGAERATADATYSQIK